MYISWFAQIEKIRSYTQSVLYPIAIGSERFPIMVTDEVTTRPPRRIERNGATLAEAAGGNY
jgi:hypothetical protein